MGFQQNPASMQEHWYYFIIYKSSRVKWCSVFSSSKQILLLLLEPLWYSGNFSFVIERDAAMGTAFLERAFSPGSSTTVLGPILFLRTDNLSYFWLHRCFKSLHAISWLKKWDLIAVSTQLLKIHHSLFSCTICSLQAEAPESCPRNTFLGTTFTLRKPHFAPLSQLAKWFCSLF